MKISREKLKEVANTFLTILDKEGVKSLRRLEGLLGQSIPVPEKDLEYVSVSLKPSNFGTRVIDVSYIMQHPKGKIGGGMPLDVKINSRLNYSQIIVKTDVEIEGYSEFSRDPFKNIVQVKHVKTIDYTKIREEIVGLT